VYDLPVGRGQRFLSSTSTLVNTLVVVVDFGHPELSHGIPFTTHTATFPINFTQDAPASSTVTSRRFGRHPYRSYDRIDSVLRDQTAALGAFSFPFGGDTGTRTGAWTELRDLDIAVSKNFTMPWSETP